MLETDIEAANAFIADPRPVELTDLANRLSQYDDPRAVDALLDLAHFRPLGAASPCSSALARSTYADTTGRFLLKLDPWRDLENEAGLSAALLGVAPRADERLIPVAHALLARWDGSLHAPSAMAALIVCNAPDAESVFRSDWIPNVDAAERVVNLVLATAPGAPLIISLLRDYQAGDDSLSEFARRCTPKPTRSGAGTPLAPSWFEFALELYVDNPRPSFFTVPHLLKTEHPKREALIESARTKLPDSSSTHLSELLQLGPPF